MNFVDFIILAVVLGALGIIAYFNFIKKIKMYAQNVHIKEKGAIAERKNNKCKKKGMIYIMDKIAGVIAQELGVKEFQVQNTIKLIDDGNTIPFIARYRKEATGGLSDEVLRNLMID